MRRSNGTFGLQFHDDLIIHDEVSNVLAHTMAAEKHPDFFLPLCWNPSHLEVDFQGRFINGF
jgi:hypothetical protein